MNVKNTAETPAVCIFLCIFCFDFYIRSQAYELRGLKKIFISVQNDQNHRTVSVFFV